MGFWCELNEFGFAITSNTRTRTISFGNYRMRRPLLSPTINSTTWRLRQTDRVHFSRKQLIYDRCIIYMLSNLMNARMTIHLQLSSRLLLYFSLETLAFLLGATNFRIALCQQPDCTDRIHQLGVPQLEFIFEGERFWETYDVPTLALYFRTQYVISQHSLFLF